MNRGLMWVHAEIMTNPSSNSLSSSLSSSSYEVMFTTTHLENFIPKNQYPLPNKEHHDGANARQSHILEAMKFCQDYQSNKVRPSANSNPSFASSSSSSLLINSSSPKNNIQAIFITGDLNWDDERKRRKTKPSDPPLLPFINERSEHEWVDAWKTCKSNRDDGYTYDSKLNPMLKGNLRKRFDRCLAYFTPPNRNTRTDIRKSKKRFQMLGVQDCELIGMEAIDGIQWRKETPIWKYGKPSGEFKYDMRPVCASDHFGVLVTLSGTQK